MSGRKLKDSFGTGPGLKTRILGKAHSAKVMELGVNRVVERLPWRKAQCTSANCPEEKLLYFVSTAPH